MKYPLGIQTFSEIVSGNYLYQSGYLTIKEYSKVRKQYRLGFLNEEVRKGFTESLYRYYASDASAFADDNRDVYKVGINISKDQRTMDDWKIIKD